MKRVFIVGCAGFIGSHTIDELLRQGYEVIGIDNLSKGDTSNLKIARKHQYFRFIKGDIVNSNTLRKIDKPIDGVFHFAAKKIPRYGGRAETVKENILGVLNVLELAKKERCRVLFASTSDVYGKNPDVPFSEMSNSVFGPSTSARWAYAASKLTGEHLCLGYAEAYDISVAIVRIFGTYGPREHLGWWGGPQSAFIENLLDGKKIELHGDGKQTRCLTYIDDMVKGIVDVFKAKAFKNELINLGSTEEISMKQLATMICRQMEKDPEKWMRFIPYASLPSRDYEDVRRRVPSLKKAEQVINYHPTVRLEGGLRQTIDWHQALRKQNT